MRILSLLLVLQALAVCVFVAARALHAKLSPLPAPALQPGVDAVAAFGGPPAVPSGRQLEEYVQAGLVDLRIMLVQAARRSRE